MKKNIALVVLIIVFLAGCNSNKIINSAESAIDFRDMLIKKLNNITKVDSLSGGHSWGDAYQAMYFIPIQDSNYTHSNTYKTCLNVFPDWEKENVIKIISSGGGENYFSFSYKENSVHYFVDVISYRNHLSKNVVQFLVRGS